MKHILAVFAVVLIAVAFAQPSDYYGDCPEGYLREHYYSGQTQMPRGRAVVTCYAPGRDTKEIYSTPTLKFDNPACERLYYQCEGSRGNLAMRQYCIMFDMRCRNS